MARLLALTIAALTGATDATLRVTGTYDQINEVRARARAPR